MIVNRILSWISNCYVIVVELGANHCKSKIPPIFSSFSKNRLLVFSPIVNDASSPARTSEIHRGLSILQPYDRHFVFFFSFFLFFFLVNAVCCTKLFKKPSALCKEKNVLRRVGDKKGGVVQWYSPMVFNPDL